ncbi:hypothetical protein SRRS_18090 [Sporomusa rhizae]
MICTLFLNQNHRFNLCQVQKLRVKSTQSFLKLLQKAINRANVPLIDKLEEQVKEINDLKAINSELLKKFEDINSKTRYGRFKGIYNIVLIAIIGKLLFLGFLMIWYVK